jgi:ribonuclease E
VRAQVPGEAPPAITQDVALPPPVIDAEIEEDDEPAVAVDEDDETEAEAANDAARAAAGETPEEAERRRRRRRRRRRGGRRDEAAPVRAAEPPASDGGAPVEVGDAEVAETHIEGVPEHAEAAGEDEHRARRRGRRGGRRRRPDGDGAMPPHSTPGADQPDMPPVYTGPTPANPFGGNNFDIFDVMEQVEAAAPMHVAPPAAEPSPAEPAPVAGLEPENAPPVAHAEAEAVAPEPERQPQPEPAASEPEPMVAANDAAPEPAVKPIIIGAGEAPTAEKKRGWWRR